MGGLTFDVRTDRRDWLTRLHMVHGVAATPISAVNKSLTSCEQ
jgi:hypothetical protein